MTARYSKFIVENARRYQLNPKLIAAVIYQESKGEARACRYEKNFFNRYIKNKAKSDLLGHVPKEHICTLDTEMMLRATSFGLMQIMGETARENGFDSDHLLDLVDPEENINLGSRLIHKFLQDTGTLEKALLRYNGGEAYPPRIIKHMDSGDADYLLA